MIKVSPQILGFIKPSFLIFSSSLLLAIAFHKPAYSYPCPLPNRPPGFEAATLTRCLELTQLYIAQQQINSDGSVSQNITLQSIPNTNTTADGYMDIIVWLAKQSIDTTAYIYAALLGVGVVRRFVVAKLN